MIHSLKNTGVALILVIAMTSLSNVTAHAGEASAKPVIPFAAALQDAKVELSKMVDGQTESFILGNGDLYGIAWEKDGALQLRIADPWITYMNRLLPRAQWQAKEVFGCEGVYYSIKEVGDHNITVPASPVFPGDQVTWFSAEPIKELFVPTIKVRAQGGFLVSAEQKEGKVTQLEITSTVGGTLRLLNPWTGKIDERVTQPQQKLVFTELMK